MHAVESNKGEIVSVHPASIRLGMDVHDVDGVYVGRVKHVDDAHVVVTRRWRDDMRFALEHVLAVLDRRVVLTVPAIRPERVSRSCGANVAPCQREPRTQY